MSLCLQTRCEDKNDVCPGEITPACPRASGGGETVCALTHTRARGLCGPVRLAAVAIIKDGQLIGSSLTVFADVYTFLVSLPLDGPALTFLVAERPHCLTYPFLFEVPWAA